MSSNKEYQHFIPQFLLRNYSHPFVCPKATGPSKKCKKHKHEKKKHPGDPVVNTLCLTSEPYKLEETPTARVFGQLDMYEDMENSPKKQHRRIEEMFGRMEAEASAIFRKITKAYGNGDQGLWLTRVERNVLRKFLFLLKYRGSNFHRRFYHGDLESYWCNDKDLLRDYMEDKGFERPIDVWFHNLETIMTLEMDAGKKWITELPKKMFTSDAMWFIMHVEMMYMAICRPANPGEEFLLTDNCYNVFEGPNTFVQDSDTGKISESGHAGFHEFAPISPDLMLVLRSFSLPVPAEDKNPEIKQFRTSMRKMAIDDVFGPDCKSMLHDLPVQKATNSYSEMVDGQPMLKPGRDAIFRKDDRFCFKLFPLETRHVRMINGIFLDNSYINSRVAFRTHETFLSTMDWWLTEPCVTGKIITGDDALARLSHVKKLAAFMESTGWDKEPVWREMPTPLMSDVEGSMLRHLEHRRFMEKLIQSPPEHIKAAFSDRMSTYKKLGGTWENFFYDMHQTGLMLKLRIKIDSWSQGVDEFIRQRNRFLLMELYMELPCCRFWLYLKSVRAMMFTHGGGDLSTAPEGSFSDGPEDEVAEFYDLMPEYEVNQLMYEVFMKDTHTPKGRGCNNFDSQRLALGF
ncbi:hypothetical protein NM208_g8647 [Fusarium decemcellulare]|uniref:Uncharacterized protein n=1 Tax=Fusarium decemcellulare TaxID=57161 RepID=A0ACC1S4H4_9HYPO|nr:hypothetical protein NM208_g8647 [Fusarium decemcellulare]